MAQLRSPPAVQLPPSLLTVALEGLLHLEVTLFLQSSVTDSFTGL